MNRKGCAWRLAITHSAPLLKCPNRGFFVLQRGGAELTGESASVKTMLIPTNNTSQWVIREVPIGVVSFFTGDVNWGVLGQHCISAQSPFPSPPLCLSPAVSGPIRGHGVPLTMKGQRILSAQAGVPYPRNPGRTWRCPSLVSVPGVFVLSLCLTGFPALVHHVPSIFCGVHVPSHIKVYHRSS